MGGGSGTGHCGIRSDVSRDPRNRGGNDTADWLKRQQRFLQRGEFHPAVIAWGHSRTENGTPPLRFTRRGLQKRFRGLSAAVTRVTAMPVAGAYKSPCSFLPSPVLAKELGERSAPPAVGVDL